MASTNLLDDSRDVGVDSGEPRFTNPAEDHSHTLQRVFVVARPQWRSLARHHVRLQELSGALGDLGSFIPYTVNLANKGFVDFGAALVMAGLYNLLTVLWLDVPVAVQPMHTIAAVALSGNLSGPGELMGAGLFVGACALLLGASGLIDRVRRFVPLAVVRGIQLGLGLGLVTKGLLGKKGKGGAIVGWGAPGGIVWFAWDGALVGVLIVAFFFAMQHRPAVPTALIVFGYGLVVTIAQGDAGSLVHLGVTLKASAPTAHEFARGAFEGGLPQLPLTLLNSVVALSLLSKDLFPGRACSERRVACSVGALNLGLLWFGAVPSCHGAGGLAAQHRFGARSSVSMLFLGALKLLTGLLFGSALSKLCASLPHSVLGSLLAFSGLELAMSCAGEGVRRADQRVVMLATAGAEMAFKSGVAFFVGMGITAIFHFTKYGQQPTPQQLESK
jgi:MFS superfamily sulfate permease-like transporter